MIGPMTSKPTRDQGFAKAARFLMLLGQDEAANIMKHLSQEEVTGISREIVVLEKMDSNEAGKVLEEFGFLVKTKDLIARGG
ncbi:MAG TPA: flagellar motor switch protein FliG, partial [bacterium]|nr:flagellar motor switch protein FliG [bacterium]